MRQFSQGPILEVRGRVWTGNRRYVPLDPHWTGRWNVSSASMLAETADVTLETIRRYGHSQEFKRENSAVPRLPAHHRAYPSSYLVLSAPCELLCSGRADAERGDVLPCTPNVCESASRPV